MKTQSVDGRMNGTRVRYHPFVACMVERILWSVRREARRATAGWREIEARLSDLLGSNLPLARRILIRAVIGGGHKGRS